MSPEFAATIVIGGSVLFSYSVIERRVNLRSCCACCHRGSADTFERECPRCGYAVSGRKVAADTQESTGIDVERRPHAGAADQAENIKSSRSAPGVNRPRGFVGKLSGAVLILVPVLVAAFDAAVIVRRRVEPTTQKAIRIVKESSSPIESFSIEQYLNSTLYYRKDRGSSIQIQGWTALETPGAADEVAVEFAYLEGATRHLADWTVDVRSNRVSSDNAEAAALSWLK
ncbi:MAG TPA: hypothetical protein VEZ90_18380 [Blastocatellia bacterium]|nr:hypothetical protein [Blastocatellia bacterium]